jgi:hypothetical protein
MKAPIFGWVALACLPLLLACSEPEEVCLTANCAAPEGGAGGGGAGGEGASGGMGGAGGMGGTAMGGSGGDGPGGAGGMPPPMGGQGGSGPVTPMPDRALFADGIAQMMHNGCGAQANCHPEEHVTPVDGEYGAYPGGINFSDEEIDGLMAEVLEWVDFDEPLEDSPLLKWIRDEAERGHPFSSSFADGEEYDMLLAWLEDAITPDPDPPMGGMGGGMGGMGGGGGADMQLCDGLPDSDPLDRPGYYERFDDRINALLISKCANGDCHAIPRNAGRLWLDTEFCSVRFNFNAVQAYINQRFPNQSPLVTQPISPNHGGRMVFRGSDDPEYVQLLQWVRLSMP